MLLKLDVYRHIIENTQISNFVKILPVGAELYHAERREDRQTDMTRLIVVFHNYANTYKKESLLVYLLCALTQLQFSGYLLPSIYKFHVLPTHSVFMCFVLISELDKLIKHINIVNHIKAQRLSWFGRVQRMPDTRTVKKIFKWNPLTKRSQGRPKYRWEDSVKQDICQMRVKNCITCIQDRGKWKDVEKAITFNH